jgi:hypothetical protein
MKKKKILNFDRLDKDKSLGSKEGQNSISVSEGNKKEYSKKIKQD